MVPEAKAPDRASAEEREIARRFVAARRQARVLAEYPGAMPPDRIAAYRIQDAAIALWPTPIGGWKTTMVIPPQYGPEFVGMRLIGPAFTDALFEAAAGEVVRSPLIDGGFSGVEPEMIVRVGRDAPADKLQWTIDEAIAMVGELCVGAELVTSPLPGLGTISLPVMASDFGANGGIVAGPAIAGWRDIDRIEAEVFIDGSPVASGGLAVRDDALDALAFTLGECAARGHPLRKGMLISTGTLTGFHPVRAGQSARFVFSTGDTLGFDIVGARPAG